MKRPSLDVRMLVAWTAELSGTLSALWNLSGTVRSSRTDLYVFVQDQFAAWGEVAADESVQ